MEQTRSFAVVYKQDPEGGYIASVPALPGCYSQGETREETEINITEAIELYLESLKAHNQSLPEELEVFQKQVTISLS